MKEKQTKLTKFKYPRVIHDFWSCDFILKKFKATNMNLHDDRQDPKITNYNLYETLKFAIIFLQLQNSKVSKILFDFYAGDLACKIIFSYCTNIELWFEQVKAKLSQIVILVLSIRCIFIITVTLSDKPSVFLQPFIKINWSKNSSSCIEFLIFEPKNLNWPNSKFSLKHLCWTLVVKVTLKSFGCS